MVIRRVSMMSCADHYGLFCGDSDDEEDGVCMGDSDEEENHGHDHGD